MTISSGAQADDRGLGSRSATGVVVRDPLPWNQLIHFAETAEATGYEAIFVPEIAAREAFSTLASFASCTSRVRLGTGVVTVQSRRPSTTARAAATVHERSGGRLILGVGVGMADRPLETTESYVRTVKEILAGNTVADENGQTFTLGLPVETAPPVWLAALGDGMIRLAGREADGVLLNWCTPERVAQAKSVARAARRQAGRGRSDVTIAVYVRSCLGVEDGVAVEALRAATAQYAAIPHYARQFERMGLGAEAAVAARALQSARTEDVPESLVRAVTVSGGRDEALNRFDEYRSAGADLVLCYPVPALDAFSSILGTLLAAAPSPALER